MPAQPNTTPSGKGYFGFTPQQQSDFAGGVGSLFGGLFGDSGAPYDNAGKAYQEWNSKAESTQNPFFNAGKVALGDYQNWLNGQSDPAGFINKLMSMYQPSAYSKYQQQQSQRAGQNAASAGGLTGSTPLIEQMQQNSANIASGDMNQWLQNVLGINTNYGQGQQNLMTGGQNSANTLTNLYNTMGERMGDSGYGSGAGSNQDFFNTIGGIGKIASMFL